MINLRKRAGVVLVAALLAPFLLAACGPSATTPPTSAPGSDPGTAAVATIIDVRRPDEYAAGHLQGAINIDVQAADFGTKIAALPHDAKYYVYCRSGVRAGNALNQMKAAGFKDVTNAGGIDAASKLLGLPIVT